MSHSSKFNQNQRGGHGNLWFTASWSVRTCDCYCKLERVVGTSTLYPVCQKHRWQPGLATGIWSGGQSYGTEPLTCGIWCYLWVDSFRIELNCRTPSCVQRIACWCGELSPYTVELSPEAERLPFHGCWEKTQCSWIRRKRWFLTHNNGSRWSIILSLCQFSKTQFPQGNAARASRSFHIHWLLLQKRNPELKNPESLTLDYRQTCPIFPHKDTLSLLYWTVNKPVLGCSRRDFLCLPRLFAIHTSLKIKFNTKGQLVPLFSRCEEMWEIAGQRVLQHRGNDDQQKLLHWQP